MDNKVSTPTTRMAALVSKADPPIGLATAPLYPRTPIAAAPQPAENTGIPRGQSRGQRAFPYMDPSSASCVSGAASENAAHQVQIGDDENWCRIYRIDPAMAAGVTAPALRW